MLNIEKKSKSGNLEVNLKGRLDTTTAVDFENAITPELKETMDVIIDMKDLAYISSAGLRVLVMIKKAIGAKGSIKLRDVSDEIKDVLEITGFSTQIEME